MVAHDVSLFDHSLHQIRAGGDKVAYHKEGGGSVMFFQGIQDCGRVSVFIAAVKGEINDFFLCVFCIISIVLF